MIFLLQVSNTLVLERCISFKILIFPSEIGGGILNFGSLNGVGDRFVSGYDSYENISD